MLHIHFPAHPDDNFYDIDIDYWAAVVFYDMLDHLPTVLRNQPQRITSRIRNASFVSFCARAGFDITQFEEQIIASQTAHIQSQLISDLIAVINHLLTVSGDTGYLRAGEILRLLQSNYPARYSNLTAHAMGWKLKHLASDSKLTNHFQINIKQYDVNRLYNFQRI